MKDWMEDFRKDPAFIELMECGKRISDTYAMHRLADPIASVGCFFAFRLSDGSTNNTLYPSRDAARKAISKHDDEDRWAYVQIVPGTLTVRDGAVLMRTQRKLYDAGITGRTMNGRVMIPRTGREDQLAQLRSIFRGTPPTNVRGVG